MIKVFLPGDRDFTSNGEVVVNASKCKITNADGGDFSMEITASADYSPYLVNQNIIVAPTPIGDQPFRLYEVQKTHNKITGKAKHITFDSNNYVIADTNIVNKPCQTALDQVNNHTDTESPFTMYSDINYKVKSYRCVRKSLKEAVDTIAERWGGHIVRDGFTISVLEYIGVDNGITIEYGKNLQTLNATYDFSKVCTKCLPVGKDGQLLDQLYVYSETQYDTPYTKVVSFEQSIEREDYDTDEEYIAALKADLRQQAQAYVDTYSIPSVNYTLKGMPEKVSDIGDVIRVYDKVLGVDITTQVISYEYDAISEQYKSLAFGNFTETLGDLISVITQQVKQSL
jgi:phage minor structural protein